MSRIVPSFLGAEGQAMSVASGLVEWKTLFPQELIHGQFNLLGTPAVMQERPPVCVTVCKSLYNHLSAVDSPSTLHDYVLIIRESMKKTGCMIRWAPTGLQLAVSLTKDKGEAVECLRRSLRSGSCMLGGEEPVMQERHMTRVHKLSAREKSSTTEKFCYDCWEGSPSGLLCGTFTRTWLQSLFFFIFGLLPMLISKKCRWPTQPSSTVLYLKTVTSLILI